MTATTAHFWDGVARKYAAQPIRNMPAYEATLADVRRHLSATDQVAEIGCGTGNTALKLAPSVGSLLATDVSPEMIAIARERVTENGGPSNVAFHAASDSHFGLAGRQLDAVLAFNLLHLVDDLPASLAAIADTLKPGGLFISKTPCLGESTILISALIAVMRLFGKAPPHVARLSMAELDQAIEAQGFRILERAGYPEGGRGHFIVARKES